MHDYVRGAGRAFLEYARRMLPAPGQGTGSSAELAVSLKATCCTDSVSGQKADRGAQLPVSERVSCGAESSVRLQAVGDRTVPQAKSVCAGSNTADIWKPKDDSAPEVYPSKGWIRCDGGLGDGQYAAGNLQIDRCRCKSGYL